MPRKLQDRLARRSVRAAGSAWLVPRLQDVPIAVTAFTTEALQSRALGDIHALSNLTPSVNLDSGAPFSGDRSVLSASIRGIGQDDFAFNLNPGVGVYLDGVYLARTIGANLSLLDVDRLEILKGPQGTLFGANTIGGAISVVTHTPGNTPRFMGTATAGEYNRRDLAFTADLLTVIGMLGIMFALNWKLGLMALVPFPVLFFVLSYLYRKIKASAKRQRKKEGRIASQIAWINTSASE